MLLNRLDLPSRLRVLSSCWPWLRHWELWLALVVGGFLRLWQLGTSQFLDDQALLMSMARDSVLHRAIPLTGIPSSIGALNPPLSVYLLIPFALLGKDPFPAIIALALWNVLGVALCYVFALRFFNRRVAGIGTLLFATSGAAVDFSRFLWQQNYMPPLLVLWAMVTFAGALRGTRGWFFVATMLLALAAMLHPTALLLVPVLLVALVLAPHKPRLWEYPAALASLLVLVAPTLIWEKVSDFSDLQVLQQYTGAAPQINLDVLRAFEQVLGPPTFSGSVGPATFAPVTPIAPYASIASWTSALWYLACALYGASYLIVTGLVIAPIIRHWHAGAVSASNESKARARIFAVWRLLRADGEWAVHLLLWLAITIVPLAMIRHASPVHAHYLHVLYPVVFILAGVGIDRLLRWVRPGTFALPCLACGGRPVALRLAGFAVVVGCITVLIAGQSLQSSFYTASQAAGQVDDTNYGYPVGELQAADSTLAALQREQGTVETYISSPDFTTTNALTYMLVSERPWRALIYGDCLALPQAGSPPILIVATRAGPISALLSTLPNARLVRTLPMPGSEPFHVYRVGGDTPALPQDKPGMGLIFQDGFGNTMRLDGSAIANDTTLRLRWTVLRMASPVGTPRHFYVDARAARPGGETSYAVAHVECDPTRWQTGETVYTWVSTAAATPPAQPVRPLPPAVAISAWDQVVYYDEPTRHGLRFLTGELIHWPPAQLVATNPQHVPLPAGLAIAHGELVAPLAVLGSP